MTDNLRERVTDALYSACYNGIFLSTDGISRDSMRAGADVLIRELGLRIQVAGHDGIVGTGDYRYVTEWTADE